MFLRFTKLTAVKSEWPDKFISALARTGNVTVAARAARISRTAAYEKRTEDEAWGKLWDEAIETAGDLLEEEARRRAHTGVLKPIYQGGARVGSVREYSDTLLIFLLKGARPAKYRENHRVEVSGPGGGAIPIREIVIERPAPAEEEGE